MPAHLNLKTLYKVHQYSVQEEYYSLHNICKKIIKIKPSCNVKIIFLSFPCLHPFSQSKYYPLYILKPFQCPQVCAIYKNVLFIHLIVSTNHTVTLTFKCTSIILTSLA